ncbi:hypothetical protein BH10PSE7_BH10PSE7_04170 [soil metagenome]
MAVKPGTDASEKVNGSNDDDLLYGKAGNDTILGFAQDDKLQGDSGNDQLFGGDGIDLLLGGSGNDLLNGGTGDDRLLGGTGADKLTAGDGNDVLDGGLGNDRLRGGEGADVFVFTAEGNGRTGKDFIVDFKDNVDTLFIDHNLGFTTAQQVVNTAHSSGGDTPLDLSKTGDDNFQIILLGIDNGSQLLNDIVIF